jgi:hypothetical protein
MYQVTFPDSIWYLNSKLVAPVEGDLPRPSDMVVMIKEEHVRDTLDTLQLIMRVKTICLDEMENGTILHYNLHGNLNHIVDETKLATWY